MNRALPKFSIVMANYNNAEFLPAAIESVLGQSCVDWELLVCDDGSTDTSRQVISRYNGDPRIKYSQNETNKGLISTLNSLIPESRASYIGTLDSDDVLASDAIEVMLRAHTENPTATLIYSQYGFFDKNMVKIREGSCREVSPRSSILTDDCAIHFRTFKKSFALKIDCFDPAMKHAEDKDFMYKLEEQGPVIFVDQELYRYRLLEESMSHGSNLAKSRIAMALGRLEAYERRLGTNIPNMQKHMAGSEVSYGIGASLNLMNLEKLIYFVKRCHKYELYRSLNLYSFKAGVLGRNLW